MLYNAHREQVYHSQREGLSVGQSSSVSDRSVQPVVERGQELNTEQAHIRTLLTDSESKSSPTVRRKSGDTNSRLTIWQKKYTKIQWNDRVATRRTSSGSSRRTSSTRSTTSSWTVIEAKLGFTWSSWEKSQRNGRLEEVSEFYFRYFCKTKISRRSGHYSGTYW